MSSPVAQEYKRPTSFYHVSMLTGLTPGSFGGDHKNSKAPLKPNSQLRFPLPSSIAERVADSFLDKHKSL